MFRNKKVNFAYAKKEKEVEYTDYSSKSILLFQKVSREDFARIFVMTRAEVPKSPFW